MHYKKILILHCILSGSTVSGTAKFATFPRGGASVNVASQSNANNIRIDRPQRHLHLYNFKPSSESDRLQQQFHSSNFEDQGGRDGCHPGAHATQQTLASLQQSGSDSTMDYAWLEPRHDPIATDTNLAEIDFENFKNEDLAYAFSCGVSFLCKTKLFDPLQT